MKVTKTRVRLLGGDGIYAIASVTIDGTLIINDIKVERHGNEIKIKLPKTTNAERNNQRSVIADESLFKEIKSEIFKKISKQI